MTDGALLFPKPLPALLDQRKRAASTRETDKTERAKCRARSGGRCEMVEVFRNPHPERRCSRRAGENHHLKGGIGRRNRNESILAEHRIELCSICHTEITRHVLVPAGPGREDAATVRYERVG